MQNNHFSELKLTPKVCIKITFSRKQRKYIGQIIFSENEKKCCSIITTKKKKDISTMNQVVPEKYAFRKLSCTIKYFTLLSCPVQVLIGRVAVI